MAGVSASSPNLPPDAIDVVTVFSELSDRPNVWVGTYINRITAGPVAWISLEPDGDKLYVVRAQRPLPTLGNTLLSAIRVLGESGLISAWVVGSHRSRSLMPVLKAAADSTTILCGSAEAQEHEAVWLSGDFAALAEQNDFGMAPLRLAVAEADRRRAKEIEREIATWSGLVMARTFPLPDKDPFLGANASFNDHPLPSLPKIVRCIRRAIGGRS